MQKSKFIILVDQKLEGKDYFNPYEKFSNICYGRLGILLSYYLNIPHYYFDNFFMSPDSNWGLVDFEKINDDFGHYLYPIEKFILLNLDFKFNYPQNINKDLLATKEQQEFFNNKIVLKEDCEYLLNILNNMEEKEKTFTEGVENSQAEQNNEQKFNPLKVC